MNFAFSCNRMYTINTKRAIAFALLENKDEDNINKCISLLSSIQEGTHLSCCDWSNESYGMSRRGEKPKDVINVEIAVDVKNIKENYCTIDDFIIQNVKINVDVLNLELVDNRVRIIGTDSKRIIQFDMKVKELMTLME